jgi:hypothetical protein
MLNLLYGNIWLDYNKVLELINVDCKKKAVLSPNDIIMDWYDIIDDCYTFGLLQNNIKSLIDLWYDAIVINALDVMLLNSFVKTEYETINELIISLVRIALAAKMKYKAKITVITWEKILMEYRHLEWWYQIQIAKFIPNLQPDLQNVLEWYCHNVWRVWIDPNDSTQKIQSTPDAKSQTFSSWSIKPIPSIIDTKKDTIEDTPVNNDTPKKEITREEVWLPLYKKPENFFEIAEDAKWLFNHIKTWESTYDELKKLVFNSKKLSADKVKKALSFISSLNKIING